MSDPQSNQPYAPTGFCVRCLYPGTPGETCSECGGRMVLRGSKEGLARLSRISPRKWIALWLLVGLAHEVLSIVAFVAAMAGGPSDAPMTITITQGALQTSGLIVFFALNPHLLMPFWLRLRGKLGYGVFGHWPMEIAESLAYSALLLFLFGRIRAWRIKRRVRQFDSGVAR